MSHYTANVKLYWNGTAVNTTSGVLAFGVGDTVPDATVTRDGLATAGLVTSQPDGGTPTPFTPISREQANAAYETVINVAGQAGATDDAKFQAAITAAAAAGGGLVFLPAGSFSWSGSVPALPPNLTGKVVIRGAGRDVTKVVLSSAAPRFLDLTKTNAQDTLGNVTIEDLTIDANSVAAGRHHLIVGTLVAGTYTSNVNLANITVRRVRGINAPADATGTNFRGWIYLAPNVGTAETQCSVRGVLVEDCDLSGGDYGVAVTGIRKASASTDFANVTIDDIYLARVKHDCGTAPSANYPSANFHLVGRGIGGRNIRVVDCIGKNAGDVGLEVDTVQAALVRGVLIEDAYFNAYYVTNYATPSAVAEQEIVYEGCHARRTVTMAAGDSAYGYGFHAVADSVFGGPPLTYRDCSWYRSSPELSLSGEALSLLTPSRVVVDNFRAVADQINTTDTTAFGNVAMLSIACRSTDSINVVLRDIYTKVAGTKGASAGAILWYPVALNGQGGTGGGTVVFNIDGLMVNFSIASPNSGSDRGVWLTGGQMGGTMRRLRHEGAVSTDSAARGVTIPTTTTLNIPKRISITDSDFTGCSNGNEINWASGTDGNRAKTYLRNNVYFAEPKQRVTITPGASPYAYQNLNGMAGSVVVAGGTVSKIERANDNATYIDQGVVAGAFFLSNGDYLRVTYSVAPTMTFHPER